MTSRLPGVRIANVPPEYSISNGEGVHQRSRNVHQNTIGRRRQRANDRVIPVIREQEPVATCRSTAVIVVTALRV